MGELQFALTKFRLIVESIIKKISEERYDNTPNSRSLAKALNLLIDSIFSDPARILYELLQNADDAVPTATEQAEEEEGIHYDIYLLDSHLVINYNGKAFDKADMESLCSIADSSKSATNHKIGYKGIGFKSVFRISDCVWIVSDNACFRFDKHYKQQAEQGYPWQIIPIWTNVGLLPKEVTKENLIATKGISIILKINPSAANIEAIRKNLNAIYNDYKMILFLRNVREITCYKKDGHQIVQTLRVLRTDNKKQGTRKIEVKTGKKPVEVHHYLVHEFSLEIPNYIQLVLKDLPKDDCPEKLRNATQTQITLAVPLGSHDTIRPNTGASNIYCYLPTSIKKQIPYHINAEFLTNADRSKFYRSNAWNDWLFEQIGYHQFVWVQDIVLKDYFKCQIPALIRVKYEPRKKDWDYSIKMAFNKGLDNATEQVPFLPEHQSTSNKLAFIAESIVDNTKYGFSSDAAAVLVKEEIKEQYDIEMPKIIDPEIENLDKIIQLGAKEFNVDLLRSLLNRQGPVKFNTATDNEGLIRFLAQTIGMLESEEERNKWNEALSATNFLLTEQFEIRPPVDLYFADPDFDFDAIPALISPSFLNSEVLKGLADSPWAKDWLKEVQVKKINPIELLKRELIAKIMAENLLDHSNIIALTRFIFTHYSQLDEPSKQKIKNGLKILTKNNQLVQAKDTYLADIYKPPLRIESLGTSVEIVSEAYIVNKKKANEWGKWNSFFSEMNVQKQMMLKRCSEKMTVKDILGIAAYTTDYISFLKEKLGTDLLEVKNLFYVTFMEELGNTPFAQLFWDRLLNSQVLSAIMQRERKVFAVAVQTKQREKVPSLFKYYIQNNPSFPTLLGDCLPTV